MLGCLFIELLLYKFGFYCSVVVDNIPCCWCLLHLYVFFFWHWHRQLAFLNVWARIRSRPGPYIQSFTMEWIYLDHNFYCAKRKRKLVKLDVTLSSSMYHICCSCSFNKCTRLVFPGENTIHSNSICTQIIKALVSSQSRSIQHGKENCSVPRR